MLTNDTNQSTGQSSTNITNDPLYDHTMLYSEECKRHDDEILEAYLEYEEFMSQENSYRSAA